MAFIKQVLLICDYVWDARMQRGQLAWRVLTQAFKVSVDTSGICQPRATGCVPYQTELITARWLVSQTPQASQAAPEPVRCYPQQAIWLHASAGGVTLASMAIRYTCWDTVVDERQAEALTVRDMPIWCLQAGQPHEDEEVARADSSQGASTSGSERSAPSYDFSALGSVRNIQDFPLPRTGKALAAIMSGIKETHEAYSGALWPRRWFTICMSCLATEEHLSTLQLHATLSLQCMCSVYGRFAAHSMTCCRA